MRWHIVGDVVGLTDGDKGDITVSSSGTVWNIDAATVGVTELSATGTANNTTFLRGDNTWATPTAADPAGWTTIVKSANQDVTNNATLQDDTHLQFSVVAGGHYMVEMDLTLSANSTLGDIAWRLNVDAGTMLGNGTAMNVGASASAGLQLLRANTNASVGLVTSGAPNNDLNDLIGVFVVFSFYASANATCRFQFANSAAGAGRTSRTWKGSIMRYKRLD